MLEPVVEARQMELYDIDYLTEHGRKILRLYIDKEGGISLDDCEVVSHAANSALDAKDPVPEAYVLEVSSPGIERKLVKDAHYMANIGRKVEVRLNKPLEDFKQKKFRGVLLGLDESAVVISGVADGVGGLDVLGEKLRLPREHLAYCRLVYEE